MGSERLRGYVLHAGDPWEGAVLVFAPTVREARALGASTIQGYFGCGFIDVRSAWAPGADASAWGVTGPTVIEPDVCDSCERWYADRPIDPDTRLCFDCMEEAAAPHQEEDER